MSGDSDLLPRYWRSSQAAVQQYSYVPSQLPNIMVGALLKQQFNNPLMPVLDGQA
jgi:hypothetical protein